MKIQLFQNSWKHFFFFYYIFKYIKIEINSCNNIEQYCCFDYVWLNKCIFGELKDLKTIKRIIQTLNFWALVHIQI